jgi:hypothetical protein
VLASSRSCAHHPQNKTKQYTNEKHRYQSGVEIFSCAQVQNWNITLPKWQAMHMLCLGFNDIIYAF